MSMIWFYERDTHRTEILVAQKWTGRFSTSLHNNRWVDKTGISTAQ